MGGSDDDTIHGGEGMDIVFGDRINNTPLDIAAPFAVDTTNKTTAFSQEFIDAQFKNGTSVSEDEFKIKLVDELNNPVKYAQEIKAAINDDNNDDFADYSSDLKTNGSDTIYGDDGNDLMAVILQLAEPIRFTAVLATTSSTAMVVPIQSAVASITT